MLPSKKYDCTVLLLLVMLLALPVLVQAQFMDSIYSSMSKKPRIIFKFDTRKSFIDNSNVTVFGWKLGVEFDKRIRIGGGFSNLTGRHSPDLDKVVYADNGFDTLALAKLNFSYICYYVEYVFLSKPKWEISFPVQFGLGSSHYRYTDETSGLVDLDKNTVALLETAVTGHYKLLKWLGIGAGAGYRIMLVNNKALEKKFNSPIYIFKLKLFLADFAASFSKKHV